MIKLKHLLPECNECGRDWNHGHDHEAGMAKNELSDMISNASKIDHMIGEGDNLPGWVSAYISLAADYMHSVSEYLAGESSRMQEPGPGYGIDEDMSPDVKEGKISPVKKVINSVLRKNGLAAVQMAASGIRGISEPKRPGVKAYKYEFPGLISFFSVKKDELESLATQMGEAGVNIIGVGDRTINFDPNNLKPTTQQPVPGPGLEEKKAQSRAQQAAIAISLQKAGKKPK